MLPHRPKITLRVPAWVYPGDQFDVVVVLQARRAVLIQALHVSFLGAEEAWQGNHPQQNRLVPERRFTIGKALLLQKGSHEFSCRLSLPRNAPPSYEGIAYRIQYEIEVHAEIDWWPDAKERFLVRVSVPKREKQGAPMVLASSKGIEGQKPYVEVSLASDVLLLGGYCVGAVSLGNIAHNRYQKVFVGLVGHQTASGATYEVQQRFTELPIGVPEEGKALPFRFQIPMDLTPTFKASLGELSWHFEAKAQVAWKKEAGTHAEVLLLPAPHNRRQERPRIAPPTVGTERIRRIWRSVASTNNLQWRDDEISGERFGSSLSIRRETRMDGPHIVGELHFASLNLLLSVQPKGGLGRLFSFSPAIPLGVSPWDARYRVQAREETQAKLFLTNLVRSLLRFDAVSMDDAVLRAEHKDNGLDEGPLNFFVGVLLLVAQQLQEQRAQIPPPSSMTGALEDWRKVAREVSGALELSRMAIFGDVSGGSFEIVTQWSPKAEPLRTEIIVRPQIPLPISQPLSLPPKEPHPSLSQEAKELLLEISPLAPRITLQTESVTLEMPAPMLDPWPLREELDRLVRLCMLLRPGVGPYR